MTPSFPTRRSSDLGARGLRTQQRILEGAVRAFAVVGYEATTVERIAQDAECSRVAFYQYFSGKDEVFRHLAGEVARQLEASFEGMATVTADAEGWSSLRAWVERHASIHASYEPLYRSFDAAAGTDEALAGGSARVAAHHSELLLDRKST